MKSLWVGPRGRGYSVVIHRQPWRLGKIPDALWGDDGRVLLLTDSRVAKHYLKSAVLGLERLGLRPQPVVLRPGEGAKSMATVIRTARKFVEMGVHRATPVIAMGGGVLGDVAGLVSSLYMRGIPLMHVPTTLLAQVDSSVGGKTGVNLPEGKNLLGTFYPPARVWTCPQFLRTLPPRRVREGLAEVLKYGYIRAPELLDKACSLSVKNPCGDISLIEEILCTSVRVKAEVVTEDERESGVRRILNFGHTLGHALEALGNYRGLTHGEAVGIGMHLALGVGESLGITQPGLRKDLEDRLRAIGLPVKPPGGTSADDLVDLALRDKKRSARGIRFVFVRAPGETRIKELEPAVLRSIIKKLA